MQRVQALIAALPLLSGCTSMMGLGAYGGMAVGTALQSRPDQALEYNIEVNTVDGKTLVFKGSTECPHSTSINSYRGHYSTKVSYSSVTQDGERWVLTGIDCDNELVDKRPPRYVLYRVIDKVKAKAYFVRAEGSAQVARAFIDADIRSSSQTPPSYFSDYGSGPYFYGKTFVDTTPPPLAGRTDPVVVYEGRSICGGKNSQGVSLSREEFSGLPFRGTQITSIEEGRLEYDRAGNGWTPTAGVDLTIPFDVAARSAQSEDGCMRLLYNGRSFILTESGIDSGIYVPAEKAIYRISRVSVSDIEGRLERERLWQPCKLPVRIERFATGTRYPIALHYFARQNPDGSYSCRYG